MGNEKRVPALRFPGFEEPLKKLNLGSMGNFIGGGTPERANPDFWQGSIPWISSSDIVEGDVHNISCQNYITEEAVRKSATKLVPKHSLLFVSRVGVGKFAVSNRVLCTSQDFTNLCLETDDPYFVAYYFAANRAIFSSIGQGTSIKGFTTLDLKRINVIIPQKKEQQKIASFLSSVDRKIQQFQNKKDLFGQYKKGVMEQIFNKEVRFKDDEGAEYPDWTESRLKDICISITSGNTKPSNGGTYPIFGSTGIIGSSFYYTHSGRYILIARVGANAGLAYLADGNFSVTDNTLIVECNPSINEVFLLNYLTYSNLNRLVFGSGQPLITAGQLKALVLDLPTLQEQTKIANFLSSIDDKINLVTKQLELTKQFKKGLLQQMFV